MFDHNVEPIISQISSQTGSECRAKSAAEAALGKAQMTGDFLDAGDYGVGIAQIVFDII
jgi:hypothetical protein